MPSTTSLLSSTRGRAARRSSSVGMRWVPPEKSHREVSGAMVTQKASSVMRLISRARVRICAVSGSTVTVSPPAALIRPTSLSAMVRLSRFSYRRQALCRSSMRVASAP